MAPDLKASRGVEVAMEKGEGPSFSILIPTIGRPLLASLFQELLPQLGPHDEVMVIGDGPQPAARAMVAGMDRRVQYCEFGPAHCWGHPQRNWAMKLASRSHILSFDDDDAVKPGALERIRKAIMRHPGFPLVFKMQHGPVVLWKEKTLTCMNVSTQMFVVPNVKECLGTWGDRYEGDLDFIVSTSLLYPEQDQSIVWCEEIIALHGMGGTDPRR
jgi:glycosyltransferase involved in cell wall biosynthesis